MGAGGMQALLRLVLINHTVTPPGPFTLARPPAVAG